MIYSNSMKPNVKFKNDDERLLYINNMINNIHDHNTDIVCPHNNITMNNVDTNSWFTIKKSNYIYHHHINNEHITPFNCDPIKYKSIKVQLFLTKKQKIIIDKWLLGYTLMYNMALTYIKKLIVHEKRVLNYMFLRKLIKKYADKYSAKYGIKIHDINYATELACNNYKSALTNYKNGNIKHFRIRCWKVNNKNAIMDLEKTNFIRGSIRRKILGQVKGIYNNKLFDFNIKCDSKLKRYANGDYYLIVPQLIDKSKIVVKQTDDFIVSDIGVRTFQTCLTKNNVVEIGDGIFKRISAYIKRRDNILGRKEIPRKIKYKNRKMINKKIEGLVDELHWKTINYMTKNYDTIIIGNINSKSIVSKSNNLPKIVKKVTQKLRLYKFKQRLNYKSQIAKRKLIYVDEHYTSKMCSCCGEIKNDLNGSKKYNCNKCGIKMGRDINGARNIYIKSIL